MSYNIQKIFKEADKFLKLLRTKKESFWQKRAEKYAFALFQEVSKSVPAYKKFLKKNKLVPNIIKNIKDFSKIPTTDKQNYLKAYDFKELVPKGNFPNGNWIFSATSGSTGEPFYFPRTMHQDLYYALTAELYLLTNFNIDKKKTLYINGFALGIWIGGLFTYQAIKHITEKNKYDITIISSGVNKEEMLKSMIKLSPYYDQVIIGGYPPFIKDFVDFANMQGFDWKKVSNKFIFSAEGFSEDFRDYIAKNACLKDIYKDTLNHYGTVDLGTMAYETPVSILIRRLALKNKKFFDALFGKNDLIPTLGQFIPEQFYFEEENGKLFCSSESGIPLVRYDLKDLGGVKKFSKVFDIAKECDIDLKKEIEKAKIRDTVWELPFVYIFAREDSAISLYGANIYPEHIRSVLLNPKFNKYCSDRFSLQIKHSKNQDPKFFIHIELNPKVSKDDTLKKDLEKAVFENLIKINSEYNVIYRNIGRKVLPKVLLYNYEDPRYFKRSGKQKWTVK